MDLSYLNRLVQQDESETLEKKSSFIYDYKTKQAKQDLSKAVVRTIAGFLNSKGGALIIGVTDNKQICGIENDLKIYDGSWDKFQQTIINKIDSLIGSEFFEYLNIEKIPINEKEICYIDVQPSTREVWFEDEFLCVRVGNTTRKYTGSQAVNYIHMHWHDRGRGYTGRLSDIQRKYRKTKPTEILNDNMRILRPSEYKLLTEKIPKDEHRIMLDALLLTGMKYDEIKEFQENIQWFDGSHINLPRRKKGESDYWVERSIILTRLGKPVIKDFIELDKKFPSPVTWRENLRRWARKAGISEKGLSPKSTRLTWTSWLWSCYPQWKSIIHATVGLGNYKKFVYRRFDKIIYKFTEMDRQEMKEFVEGWM
jgi:hypothetical protein